MDGFLTTLQSYDGNTIVIVLSVGFLYFKLNFVAKEVNQLKITMTKHLEYHLCQSDKKG